RSKGGKGFGVPLHICGGAKGGGGGEPVRSNKAPPAILCWERRRCSNQPLGWASSTSIDANFPVIAPPLAIKRVALCSGPREATAEDPGRARQQALEEKLRKHGSSNDLQTFDYQRHYRQDLSQKNRPCEPPSNEMRNLTHRETRW